MRDYLNARGEFIDVYANMEAGQAMRNQVDEVVTAFCYRIAAEADIILKITESCFPIKISLPEKQYLISKLHLYS